MKVSEIEMTWEMLKDKFPEAHRRLRCCQIRDCIVCRDVYFDDDFGTSRGVLFRLNIPSKRMKIESRIAYPPLEIIEYMKDKAAFECITVVREIAKMESRFVKFAVEELILKYGFER